MTGYYESLEGTDYTYKHGLPFSEIIAKNIASLMERIRKNKASMIVIDGSVGEGKTTLAIHIADYINIVYGGIGPIAFDKEHVQLALGGKEFGEKLLACHDRKLLVIIYDEAGDFDKKTTLSRFNRNLMRIFEQYRGFKILVILCLPRFYKLENELFDNSIPRLLLHTHDRTENYGSFVAFDLEQMYYIKESAKKIIVKPKCYDFGMPNFYGHFLDLPKERSIALDILSTNAKRRDVKKNVYDVKNRISKKMIAEHFNRSIRWVELTLKKIDVGEVKTFEQNKWYDRSVIDKIEALEAKL